MLQNLHHCLTDVSTDDEVIGSSIRPFLLCAHEHDNSTYPKGHEDWKLFHVNPLQQHLAHSV